MTASVTDRLREYFDQNEVPYRLIEHGAAGSADAYHAVLGTRYEEQAKAVFLRHKGRDGRGFATLAVQAQKRADLRRVTSLLGAREVRLGTRDQLRETTGCDFGELPPVGRLFGIPLVFDEDLLRQHEIYFNAGSLTVSMAADPRAIDALEQAIHY
jgi:Ala-tRNA(Pro) deacylase